MIKKITIIRTQDIKIEKRKELKAIPIKYNEIVRLILKIVVLNTCLRSKKSKYYIFHLNFHLNLRISDHSSFYPANNFGS